ncbi:MAG: hypothetical protein JST92_12655, partial [Deltaproteobacteria bacterium]|nr:hypothetical protein [Deltaproteobacteria bacterium]
MQRFLPLLALLFLACGHLRPPAPADPSAYGYSMATSIEVCGPRGETAYLSRLRCANGARPKFSRTGSYGSRTPIPAERRQDPDMIKEIMGPVGPGRPD